MSSNDSYEDSEHLAKKPRLDSGGDQDVPMTMAAVTDGIAPQIQNEAMTTDSSPTIQASYSFTITNGQLINTNQPGTSLLPKAPQNIQVANPGLHHLRPVVSQVTMAPGQFPLATGGLGIRPGATMTSVIRPGIQLQTISSLPVHGGQTKVLTAGPGAPLRVPLQMTQPHIGIPGQQGQNRPVQMVPVQQAWTVDGKMTLQIANNTVRAVHPRGTTGVQQGIGLTTPQIRTSVPTIAVHKNGQVSVLQKQGLTKVSSASDVQKLQSSTQPDAPSVSSPAPQISFQVPLNWSGTGNNKSLLDSGKLSVLSSAQVGNQSPKPQSSTSLLEPVSPTVTTEPTAAGYQTTSINNSGLPSGITLPPGMSLITTTSMNSSNINLPPGMSVTPIQKPVTSVTISGAPKLTAAKGGSFVLSTGNKVAFVPSSQVLTQIVKTDNIKSGKVTMAEAQIMLPSGPAKISWPVPPHTAGKHVLALHSGPSPLNVNSIRPSSVSASLIASSKLVKDGAGHSKFLVQQGTGTSRPQKNLILKTQQSWELVKQAPLLMPKKTSPPAGQESTLQSSDKPDENRTEVEKNEDVSKEAVGKKDDKTESERSENSGGKIISAENESNNEQSEAKSGNIKENPDGPASATTDTHDKTNISISQSNEEITEHSENNNNEPDKKIETGKVVQESVNKLNSDTREEHLTERNENEEMKNVTESDSKNLVIDADKAASVGNLEENTDNSESMETDDTGVKETDAVDDMKTAEGDSAEFDAIGAMEWKDGVGELPGSDLKFRMNDLGVLEVITDDLLCTETLNTSSESEKSSQQKTDTVTVEPGSTPVKEEPSGEQPSVSNKDEIVQCENCSEYGFVTEFYKDGRFCSQTCVGAFDSKRMREVKRHGAMSRVVLGLKNKRKKLLLKGGLHRSLQDIKKEPGLQGGKKPKAFIWSKYLSDTNSIDTPPKLFKNPFPSARNNFRVGMRLEGVDPCHQSLFCVLTVAELCGNRIRLHFDGFSECYDFWTDIDSPYIFPVGFCEKNNKLLQPPKGFAIDDFSWSAYLKVTKGSIAPKSNFSNQPIQSVTPNAFRVGSKLEAVDKKNSSLICVATIKDTMGDKVLVHFDGWDSNYDYWCDVTSPFIHPIGYCDSNGYVLSPPCNYSSGEFYWDTYLSETKSAAVPARAFKPKAPVPFVPGMKIEVVDKRNPVLVRVATIVKIENHMVKIHFDGWYDKYDFWLDDDSPDLHPPGWCAKTGHPLVPPITEADLVVSSGPGVCPTPGCKGIGHIKGPKFTGHHSTFGCPYSDINMNKETVLVDRLGGATREESGAPPTTIRPPEHIAEIKRCQTEGCDGSGHVTGKFPYHSKPSGCPKLAQNKEKKDPRGRKPRSYYINQAEQEAKLARELEEKELAFRQDIHNSVFMSAMITTPRNDEPLCWEQHSKLLPGVSSIVGNNVTKWKQEDVAAFVKTLPGCEEHANTFIEEQIDGEAFLLLTQSDLVKILNIKLGPALKIFNSIIMFKNTMEV